MATIRAEGERKSWSEQNKERVWAAVTSCLTNVPPTLLRAVAAAAGAAAEPAGGRGYARGSVGRFPSNSRPRERPVIHTLGVPPAQPREPGQEHCSPPLASLASLASSPGAPQTAPAAWALDGGKPEPNTGAKRTRARSSRPARPGSCTPRNLPFCARSGAFHSRPGRELRCLAPSPRASAGASRALPEPPPLAAGTPSFLLRQPRRCRFDFARCSAEEAAKLQTSGVGLPAHLWKNLALAGAPSTFPPFGLAGVPSHRCSITQ